MSGTVTTTATRQAAFQLKIIFHPNHS